MGSTRRCAPARRPSWLPGRIARPGRLECVGGREQRGDDLGDGAVVAEGRPGLGRSPPRAADGSDKNRRVVRRASVPKGRVQSGRKVVGANQKMKGGLQYLRRVTADASWTGRSLIYREDHALRAAGHRLSQRLIPRSPYDERSAEKNYPRGYITGERMLVSYGRFGHSDWRKILLVQEAGHRQRHRSVRGITAGGHPFRRSIDALHSGGLRHSLRNVLQHSCRDWSAVETISLPPVNVARQNVRCVERFLTEQARRKLQRH